jgi:hypothetical protein
MPITPTIESTGSPARTVIRETAAAPRRRNPARIALAKVLSVIRGDRYMVNAYPPTDERAAPNPSEPEER